MATYPIQHRVPVPASAEPPRVSCRPPLEGAAKLVVVDLAPGAFTAQSSAHPTRPAGFARPTAPEERPFWAIDLQRPVALERLVVRFEALAPGATVRVHAYTIADKAGAPPVGACILAVDVATLAEDADGRRVLDHATFAVARFVWIAVDAPVPVVLTIASAQVYGVTLFGATMAETYAKSFSLFADRTLFLARTGVGEGAFEPTATYREVWERGVRVARALATHVADERGRVYVALATKNRPEWLVVEIACILQGYVLVPLAPDEPEDRILAVLERCPPHVIVCEEARAEALASRAFGGRRPPVIAVSALDDVVARTAPAPGRLPATYDEDALFTILFTSGSTGVPKGAMRSYRKMHTMLVTYGVPQPARHLSFQPLSHLSERHYMPAVVVNGGVVAFGGGGAHLPSDLAALEPSWVSSVPRLYDVVRAGYERKVEARLAVDPSRGRATIEDEVLAETRGVFGRSLQGVSTGSAPVSAETLRFLARCFADIWLFDGYGSTEVGTIAASGKIPHDVEVRLDRVEGQPEGRGEILVRSPHVIDGYFGDDDASRASLTADGFFRTGDLGERTAEGGVRVVGRLASAVKLGQGDFVSVDRVETDLHGASIVDRIFVHPAPSSTSLFAVVVPAREVLAAALGEGDAPLAALCAHPRAPTVVLEALRRHGREAKLLAHEIPTAVVLEAEPFTAARGLLTTSGKLARRSAIATYGGRLAALAEASPSPAPAASGSLLDRIVAVAAHVAAREVSADEPLADGLGRDSLVSAELLAAIGDTLGRAVPLAAWFRARTIRELATLLVSPVPSSDTARVAAADRSRALPATFVRAPLAPPRHVLLTGATGLLGAHVLEELLRRTSARVTCLIRGGGAGLEERVSSTLRRYRVPSLDPARWSAIAGDLAAEGLALDPAAARMVADDVDTIVHVGAHVTWLHLYEGVREANVGGTAELLRLAATGRAKTFAYVSTISTAPATGDESTTLSFADALRGSGYALSKWVAEELVTTARARGLSATVHRPGLVTGHSERGRGNADDFVHRYLAACARFGVALDREEILDMTAADYVSAGIVAALGVAAPPTTHLCNVTASLSFAAVGRAIAATGRPCRLVDYATFRAAAVMPRESPLRPLVSYFPEGTFTMGSGPFPSARTAQWLASRGIVCAKVDDATIARMLDALV